MTHQPPQSTSTQVIVDEHNRLQSVTIRSPAPPKRHDLSIVAHFVLEMYGFHAGPGYLDREMEHHEIVLHLDSAFANTMSRPDGSAPARLTWMLSRKETEIRLEMFTTGNTDASLPEAAYQWTYQPISGVMESRLFQSDPDHQDQKRLVEYLMALGLSHVDAAVSYIYEVMPKSDPKSGLYDFMTLCHLTDANGFYAAFYFHRAYPKSDWIDRQVIHRFQITPVGFKKGHSRLIGRLTRAQILGEVMPQ